MVPMTLSGLFCIVSLREWKWETSEWVYSNELKLMMASYFFGCLWLLTFIDAVNHARCAHLETYWILQSLVSCLRFLLLSVRWVGAQVQFTAIAGAVCDWYFRVDKVRFATHRTLQPNHAPCAHLKPPDLPYILLAPRARASTNG